MKMFAHRRLAAILLLLTFIVGLPMQGTAMAPQVDWNASGELSMPDGCNGCGDEPATSMICPIVVCIGLSAIVFERLEVAPIAAPEHWILRQQAGIGMAHSPEPHPPRI